MTKSQLIECIAEKAPQVDPRQLEAIVNAVFERMTQALKAGERIELRGFGCFGVKSRPARIARNPKTGVAVSLPRRLAVSFAAGKALRERIRGGSANLTDPEVGRTFRCVGATGRNTG
jgi:integration host factor subunit beta